MEMHKHNAYNCPNWIIEQAPENPSKEGKLFLKTNLFKVRSELHARDAYTKIVRPSAWVPTPEQNDHLKKDCNWIGCEDLQGAKNAYIMDCCMKECFPIGLVVEYQEIKVRFEELGKRFNFTTQHFAESSLICDKGRKPSATSNGSLRTSCPCKISLTFLFSYPHGSRKRDYGHRKSPNALCMIKSVTATHNHSCNKAEVFRQIKRSGKVSKAIPEKILQRLLMYAKNGSKLSTDLLRTTLAPSFPTGYVLTHQDLGNLRKRIRLLLRTMSTEEIRNFDKFCETWKSRNLMNILEDSFDYGVNVSSQQSQACVEELRRVFASSPAGKTSSTRDGFPINSIASINQLFKDMDENFDYRLDIDQKDNSIRSICWMTGAQRDNFSRNGSNISIDVQKRDFCTTGHVYMSVSMRRDDNSVCLAIEALVESETVETYAWLFDQLFEMCHPSMRREDIKTVGADQFLSQSHVTDRLKLPNALLMFDWWHLENRNFPDNIKPIRYVHVEQNLRQLLRSRSKTEFEETYSKINSTLIALNPEPKELDYLNNLSKQRHHFAQYILDLTPCTFGLHGSTASEVNHASFCNMFVHDGDYHEHPVRMQADLLTREMYQQRIYDQTLTNQSLKLSSANMTTTEPLLKEASSCVEGKSLSWTGFEIMKKEVYKLQYLQKRILDDGSREIIEIIDGSEQIYAFEDDNSRCPGCRISVAMDAQCRHEIKNHPIFDISRWNTRYHFHKYLTLIPRNNICLNSNDGVALVENDSRHSYDGNASVVNSASAENHSMEENIDLDLQKNDGMQSQQFLVPSADGDDFGSSQVSNGHEVPMNTHVVKDLELLPTKDIDFHTLSALAQNMVSRVSKAPNDVKELVAGLFYGINKITCNDWQEFSTSLHHAYSDFINARKTSKTPSEGVSSYRNVQMKRRVPRDPTTIPTSHKRVKGRIALKAENRKQFISRNAGNSTCMEKQQPRKQKNKCGFCSQAGHIITNSTQCKKQHEYLKHSTAFNDDINVLKRGIRHSEVLGEVSSSLKTARCNRNVFKNASSKNSGKHVIIHSVHPKCMLLGERRLNELDALDLCISPINFEGDVVPAYANTLICANDFFDLINKFDLKQRKVFDQTRLCKGKEGFYDRNFTQMSQDACHD